jgi:polysaccharide export outer membrane protein
MRWLKALALVLVVSLPGCALSPRPATYPVEIKGPYTLDTGDVVRVTVYGDESLSTTYKVEDNGAVAFPLVGAVTVRGATTQATAAKIAAALANGYMRNPDVAVEIAEYRPFFIQGAVKNGGQFPYVYGMTVRAAISTAGGFSDTADRSKALLYRRAGSEMSKGAVELDFPIFPGDTIVVSERWF